MRWSMWLAQGILDTSKNQATALAFVNYLLSPEAQQYFADETVEYPLAGKEIQIDERLKPLSALNLPQLDLGDLSDLQATLELLQEVGALQ